MRRKNTEKARKNHHKLHYRAHERALVVITARQRGGGPLRTWISKSEGGARPFIRDALKPGTTLFTDEGPEWSWFRGKFRLFQINHKKAYYQPNACTNQVESVFAALRGMERIHRHIGQNYADLYAADNAWRIGRNKQPDHVSFTGLMETMSRQGKSDLRGYFQGRKRQCPLRQFDVKAKNGTTVGWRPPSKKERQRPQPTDGNVVPFVPRWLKSEKVWDRGFTFLNAADVIANPSQIPQSGGVYVVFLRNGDKILEESGFTNSGEQPAWSQDGAVHVYTGETYALQTRILQHLAGDCGESTLRETLLALQWFRSVLSSGPVIGAGREQAERTLTDWLASEAVIGFRNCGYVCDAEAAILKATASPLNIGGRRQTQFALALEAMRKQFNAEIINTWPKLEYRGHRPRR